MCFEVACTCHVWGWILFLFLFYVRIWMVVSRMMCTQQFSLFLFLMGGGRISSLCVRWSCPLLDGDVCVVALVYDTQQLRYDEGGFGVGLNFLPSTIVFSCCLSFLSSLSLAMVLAKSDARY